VIYIDKIESYGLVPEQYLPRTGLPRFIIDPLQNLGAPCFIHSNRFGHLVLLSVRLKRSLTTKTLNLIDEKTSVIFVTVLIIRISGNYIKRFSSDFYFSNGKA
jgi:hypothetical protein